MKFFPDIGQGFHGEIAAGIEKKGKNFLPGFGPGQEAEGFIPQIRGLFFEAGQNRRGQGFSPEKSVKEFPGRRFPDQVPGASEGGFKKYFCLFGRFGLYDQARVKRDQRMGQDRRSRRGQEKIQVPPFEPFRRLVRAYPPARSRAAGSKAEDSGKKREKNPSDLSSWAEYGLWFPK
jgi:hypothetical protein